MTLTNGQTTTTILKIATTTLASVVVLMSAAWAVDLRTRTANTERDLAQHVIVTQGLASRITGNERELQLVETRLVRIENKIDQILNRKGN